MSKSYAPSALIIAGALSLLSYQAAQAQSSPKPVQLPEVQVTGNLTEEAAVGPYNQPEWTTHRRFSTTRVYIQRAPWEVEVEQWWRGRFQRNGSSGHLFQEEVSVGLPYRSQLDLYENWVSDDDGHMRHHDVATELRWAPADWGKIPLNPTFYGEWKFVDKTQGPDVFELKVLLGEELAPRWHWGLNAIYEQEVGGSRATEWAFSQGVSYTLIDQKLSAGLEMKFTHETTIGTRSNPEIKFVIGPSIQWRPWSWMHLDIVPLLGTTGDSPRVEAYAVLGIDIWSKDKHHGFVPTSTRGQ